MNAHDPPSDSGKPFEKREGEAPAEPRTVEKHGSAGASPSRKPASQIASEAPIQLDRIQRWFQSVIMHPGGVVSGILSPDAQSQIAVEPAQLDGIVTPSVQLSSVQRLEIYANAYFLRLLECLREEFPAVRHAVGPEAFDCFALEYLRTHPSTTYTLGRLGAGFPDFLRETRPPAESSASYESDWSLFLIELATLERLDSEIFDGPGTEGQPLVDATKLESISPERWPEARLIPVTCLNAVRFQHPVHEYIAAVRRQADPAWPLPAETYLAITRRDYVIRRIPLSLPQFQLLSAIIAGQTIGEAIRHMAADSPVETENLANQLRNWFAEWTTAGFFCDVVI